MGHWDNYPTQIPADFWPINKIWQHLKSLENNAKLWTEYFIYLPDSHKGKRAQSSSTSDSTTLHISAKHLEQVIDTLRVNQNRDFTKKNYLQIWQKFNKFLVKLDYRCKVWEDRAAMYLEFLVEKGVKSTTLRCYISAIKHILTIANYTWNDDKVLLSVIVRGCKLKNDVQKVRLLIHFSLLELILFELDRLYGNNQPYLQLLYRAMFTIAYYRLMRISKIADSNHTLLAKDVHIGQNKNKILLVLHSSKTHGKESMPQKIKISAVAKLTRVIFFCPFKAMCQYLGAHRP